MPAPGFAAPREPSLFPSGKFTLRFPCKAGDCRGKPAGFTPRCRGNSRGAQLARTQPLPRGFLFPSRESPHCSPRQSRELRTKICRPYAALLWETPGRFPCNEAVLSLLGNLPARTALPLPGPPPMAVGLVLLQWGNHPAGSPARPGIGGKKLRALCCAAERVLEHFPRNEAVPQRRRRLPAPPARPEGPA